MNTLYKHTAKVGDLVAVNVPINADIREDPIDHVRELKAEIKEKDKQIQSARKSINLVRLILADIREKKDLDMLDVLIEDLKIIDK